MQGSPYVKYLSCCSSYFNLASSCRIILPSFSLEVLSSLAKIARWTSSIAFVLRCQLFITPSRAILTRISGHRSRAEMKAKDERSEVEYGAIMTFDTILAAQEATNFGLGLGIFTSSRLKFQYHNTSLRFSRYSTELQHRYLSLKR